MPHILHPLPFWPLLMEHPPRSSNFFHHIYHPHPTAIERLLYPLGNLACRDIPLSPYSLRGHQKSWDQPRVEQLYLSLLSSCDNDVSRACLLAAASKHSGVWLNAPPVSSLGLRMCTETIHTAVGLRVGAVICHPHSCKFCGKEVDQLGYHGLLCRYSQGHLARHNAVNSVIHRSLAAAKIPSRLEHSGLHRSYGKRPNSITTPWSEGKFLVWDATCVDTFYESH